MNKIREIQRLNKTELERGVPPSASWHTDYRHTAYIYFGGLSYELTEGDVIAIFSQFGEPTFVKLARDRETGKSRGFGWLKYEDQRSCDLAVDNLGGATILNRMISVDHAEYKKRDDEEDDDDIGPEAMADSGPRDPARRSRRDGSESGQEQPKRKLLPEEMDLMRLIAEHDDEDPMKAYLVDEKKKEVKEALARQLEAEERHDRSDRKYRKRRVSDTRRKRRDRDDIDDSRHHRRRAADDDDEEEEEEDRRRSHSDARADRDRRRHRHGESHKRASPHSRDERSRHDRQYRSQSSSDYDSHRRYSRRERSPDRRDRRDRRDKRDDSNDGRRRRT